MHAEVSVRELKTHLSAFLRRVKEGETIIITQRGKAVGQIIPINESTMSRIEALMKAGLVSWNGERLPPMEPVAKIKGERTVADIIVADRG